MKIKSIRHIEACAVETDEGTFYQIDGVWYCNCFDGLKLSKEFATKMNDEYSKWRAAFQKYVNTTPDKVLMIREQYHSKDGISIEYGDGK